MDEPEKENNVILYQAKSGQEIQFSNKNVLRGKREKDFLTKLNTSKILFTDIWKLSKRKSQPFNV